MLENDKHQEFVNKYSMYKDIVYRICYSFLDNIIDAEDVFQDVFLKYYLCNKTFTNQDHEKYWLIRITVNQCKNYLKSSWKKKVIINDHYVEQLTQPQVNKNVLFEFVRSLPEKHKEIIILYYYDELSVNEISKILKVSTACVLKRLERARQMIKNKKEEKNEN